VHISIEEMMEFVAGYVEEKVLGELLKSVKEAMRKKKKLETTLKSIESTLSSIIPVVQSINELNEKLDREDEDIGRLWKQIKEGQELVSKCSKGNCCGSCFKQSNCTEELRDFDHSLKSFYDFVLPLKGTKILIDTREDVNEIKEKVRDIREGVRDIHDNVKQVKEIHRDVKDIYTNVEGVGERVKVIHDEVQEVKEVREEVKVTHVGVKDIQVQVKEIHEEVKDMRKDLRSNIQTEKAASPMSNSNVPLWPFTPPEPPQITVGLDKPTKDLKNELFKDGMSTVVLTAPGGCGKTTLAKKLCHDEAIEGSISSISQKVFVSMFFS
jgi:DNA repair exonuclease SbcCD ATPase subunit